MSIILHGDPKVIKNGGRNIAPMSEEEFLEKIRKFIPNYEEFAEGMDEAYAMFRYILSGAGVTSKIHDDFKGFAFTGTYKEREFEGGFSEKTVKNDLHFEDENAEVEIKTVGVGCPFIFVTMCGCDSQWPFCWMIYHDGKTFRVFVPTYGNNWIPFTKGGKSCKGLVACYDAYYGYEFGGEPDWKFILKALGNSYDNEIIAETCKDIRRTRYNRFLEMQGINLEDFEEYDLEALAKERCPEYLKELRKGKLPEVTGIDEYILEELKETIFRTLKENMDDTDEDRGLMEFKARVEPIYNRRAGL